MLLILDFVPGSSVGPFTLGMPLRSAMKYVRDRKADYRCVEVKYADQALFNHDLILNFPEHGMHLRFEPSSQQLRLIEIYDVSRMQLRYGRGVFGGASHAATALLVYELMGPTFPGKYDVTTKMYHLHYPGLLFMFPIPPQHAQHCLAKETELHLEFPDNTTPVASRICIHAGSADTPQDVARASPPSFKSHAQQAVKAVLGRGLTLQGGVQTVSFGDSPQDVCSALGNPTSTVLKPADPAVKRKAQTIPAAQDYFYSYANSGIDVLFDGTSHGAKKFVLRTNAPGHSEFNSYSKCMFSLDIDPSSPASQALSGPSQSSHAELHQEADGGMGGSGQEAQLREEAPGSDDLCVDTDDTFAQAKAEDPAPSASSIQGTVQEMFKDVFVSPRSKSTNATPTKGQQEEGEGFAWGKAAEWSKNILDMSARPFAFVETAAESQDASRDPHASVQPGGKVPAPIQASVSLPKDYRTPVDTQAADWEDEGDVGDQRDGWDDADSDLLGLDLLKSDGNPQGKPEQGSRELNEAADPPDNQQQSMQHGREPVETHVLQPGTANNNQTPSTKATEAAEEARGLLEGKTKEEEQLEALPPVDITSDSHFRDIQNVMGDAGMATVHTSGLGSNPFARTHVHGYKGVAFEVMRNGYMASMTLFSIPC